MAIIKCKDFETSCGNSDAKCFVDREDDYEFLAKCRLVEDNNLCEHCTYNKKFENFTYDEWGEYKKLLDK